MRGEKAPATPYSGDTCSLSSPKRPLSGSLRLCSATLGASGAPSRCHAALLEVSGRPFGGIDVRSGRFFGCLVRRPIFASILDSKRELKNMIF